MLSFGELKRNLKKDASSFPQLRIALLGDTATQFLAMAIQGMGYESGYHIELFESEYDQIERQILDLTSELYAFSPEIIILFQSSHKLLVKHGSLPTELKSHLAQERLEFLESACQSLKAKIIYLNYPEIDDGVFGSYANRIESSFTFQIRKLNYELMRLSEKYSNFFICDVASIQNKLGRDSVFNSAIYTNTEMVFSIEALPHIASRILDIICAMNGRFKKCLILDLDNTLWGGIIGDDGLERIQIGHGLGIGKAFSEFQIWVKKLQARGIIIAICSKNEEATAKEPFEKHPDMFLRLEDISVFIANWENKADNIRRIQEILNIGFDSMVFLDDNPFERNLVRENIPEISVPELPEDPADYLEFLYSQNLFETATYSTTDAERTKHYQEEATRTSLRNQFVDEESFLRSLSMVSVVKGFDAFNIPRIAQLSQRSNQFNLRTIRYTEADVERIANDQRYQCFSFTLQDKFGDHGLICAVILEKCSENTLFIDTWFMSCRVLKRGMEDFTLNVLAQFAIASGFTSIKGEYIATAKNSMVKVHFPNLGFSLLEEDQFRSLHQLHLASFQLRECFITRK